MARTLAERAWIHDPNRLREVRAYLTEMIADEEEELGELIFTEPSSDTLIGIARRRGNIDTLRETLRILPNMPERKGIGY